MLPMPIINKTSMLPERNHILTFLETQGKLTTSLINDNPTDYYTSSVNAITFLNDKNAFIQVGTSGIPSAWQINNNTNFTIETYVKLSGTNTRILCGNLHNSGTGSYWVVLNNIFGNACQVALDGYSTSGAVQRFHFGTSPSTIPVNVWNHIVIQRVGATLTVILNGVSLGNMTMTQGFQANANPFMVGNSVEHDYVFNGTIDSFYMSMQNI